MILSEELGNQIDELSEAGNEFADAENFEPAIDRWSEALELLPMPRADWEAYTWLYASIGDAYYQLKNLECARNSFFEAMNGPDGPSNPFIHYRLGQCSLMLGNKEAGVDHLLKAYMLVGESIFQDDHEEGTKYLDILEKERLTTKKSIK